MKIPFRVSLVGGLLVLLALLAGNVLVPDSAHAQQRMICRVSSSVQSPNTLTLVAEGGDPNANITFYVKWSTEPSFISLGTVPNNGYASIDWSTRYISPGEYVMMARSGDGPPAGVAIGAASGSTQYCTVGFVVR